jgi:type IV pilus assembly protein PilV
MAGDRSEGMPGVMRSLLHRRGPGAASRQGGNFLLEALIGLLIVMFGILGLIGLQAKTIQNVTDAQFRGEAVFLANSLIGQMWITDQTQLVANFATGAAPGTPYDEFKKFVAARLPGAGGANVPAVTVTPAVAPLTGTLVTVTVFWQPPGDQAVKEVHEYVATAVVQTNGP